LTTSHGLLGSDRENPEAVGVAVGGDDGAFGDGDHGVGGADDGGTGAVVVRSGAAGLTVVQAASPSAIAASATVRRVGSPRSGG
jgi:hypothetical protein